MRRLALVQAALLSAACAGTFYVSPQGHDSNSGTAQNPWATLQHAVDMISVGDTILVQSGAYGGCRIELSGGLSTPKVLQAAAGAQVLLNRPGRRNRHNSILEVGNTHGLVTDWMIAGFEVANSHGAGIDLRATDRITLQGNHVHDNRRTGISSSFSDHLVIQNNESDHNGEHGIAVSNRSTGATIRSNKSHHNTLSGIQMSGGSGEQEGEDAPQGLPPNGPVERATVENNVIWENGREGGSGINSQVVDDSMFRNNLLYNNHASGITLAAGEDGGGSNNNKIYNNTVVMAVNSRWALNIPSDEERPGTGNVVENNILYTPDLNRGSILIGSAGAAGLKSDYNVVVGRFSDNDGHSTMNLAQWQALGFDTHSIVSTPAQLFVDPAHQNFQLGAGSPAVDSGAALSDVPTDILGVTRPQGLGWDIGCYESAGPILLLT